jgi:chromosome condensin MukBEF complex kleisin-like MukF subunit
MKPELKASIESLVARTWNAAVEACAQHLEKTVPVFEASDTTVQSEDALRAMSTELRRFVTKPTSHGT